MFSTEFNICRRHASPVGNALQRLVPTVAFAACLFIVAFSQLARAQGAAEVDIANGTVARNSADHPVWMRAIFKPLSSGSHTIRVGWLGTDETRIRFSLFQVVNGENVRLATSDEAVSGVVSRSAEITSVLDVAGQYFLGVWAVTGHGEYTASIEAAATVTEAPRIASQYSLQADNTAWMLDGPAPTLDYQAGANTDGWGRALLLVDDILLVGGDFRGIKPDALGSSADTINRPWLAALNADTGQPVASFAVPSQVDGVVRSLALSPDGSQVFVGGDFGLVAVNAKTGALDFEILVRDGNNQGSVFEILFGGNQLYIGGDFTHINNSLRGNLARLSLRGQLDTTWSPFVSGGVTAGRSAPVQALALSPSGDTLYVGGTFRELNDTPVSRTWRNTTISMMAVGTSDGVVKPERFQPELVLGEFEDSKHLIVHDIAVSGSYIIIAWGGPNYLTFHQLDGARLQQYQGPGDVQAVKVVGDRVIVGHHGEFLGSVENPLPTQAVSSIDPMIVVPYKLHTFRLDSQSARLLPDQNWQMNGTFGVWAIAASDDSIWIAGNLRRAGSSRREVEGLVRFPAVD